MIVSHVAIRGFRGIQDMSVRLEDHSVLVGPNGSGKSSFIDAIALVLGRDRLVRSLTDHDFFGGQPGATDRIRVVATLTGFEENDPSRAEQWFRDGRAVERWYDPSDGRVHPIRQSADQVLCAQIAVAARFDLDSLEVEYVRYFHDDDSVTDPFADEGIARFPTSLLKEIGFFLVPTRRTWDRMVSFESELFRRLVRTTGSIPAATIQREQQRLQSPAEPLEQQDELREIAGHIDDELARLLPGTPSLRLRVTSTDADGVLQALTPHYQYADGISLAAGRHGSGLVSLQTLLLLLEFGRIRHESGENFIVAIEEPELHLPPALQRRVLFRAQAVANQTLCTTHAPHVASFYRPTQVLVLGAPGGPTRLSEEPLNDDTPNAVRKLLSDRRESVIDALLHTAVLIPEGRGDYELIRLLVAATHCSEGWDTQDDAVSFGTVVGVIPTQDASVVASFERLRTVRGGLIPMVDGDAAGREYVRALGALATAPQDIVILPEDWTIEDVLSWLLEVDADSVVERFNELLETSYADATELVTALKDAGGGGLKNNYLAYEHLIDAMRDSAEVLARARVFLAAITAVGRSIADECPECRRDDLSTAGTHVWRLHL